MAGDAPHRQWSAAALLLALLMLLSAGFSPARVARADSGTVTPTDTPGVTLEPTPRPTPTLAPSPTTAPTATARPTARPTSAPEVVKPKKHKHKHKKKAKATVTPTATHTSKHKHRHKKRAKPTATPKPTKTATPALNLQADNSITPVTCNGPKKPNASTPFLLPPFHGWTSIVSYFDHDLPNFAQDGLVQIADGLHAAPDPLHQRSDFPAYWNGTMRQYLYYDGHNGYDYNLWYQPVYAGAAGKVIFAAFEYPDFPDHGYGKMVMIDHGNGYVTLYGHFSQILVHKGQRVKAGQQIGVSGNTGHSSGPHLHFTVFHNCSPTDPYGWTAQSEDALESYQGEASTYLWRQPPLVPNLPRDWPEASTLPASSVTRIALLRLPAVNKGSGAFTRALSSEADAAARTLRKRGLFVKIDLLRGALIVSGTFTSGLVYSAPQVVSITTSDTEEGARDDVLHSLALAAQFTKHARLHVGRSSQWTGFLLHWQHRTFLVGTGQKGGDVNLHLDGAGGKSTVHRLHADPETGAFAADLGPMSQRDTVSLSRELEGRGTGGSSITPRAPAVRPHAPAPRPEREGRSPLVYLTPIVLLGLAGACAFLMPRWRRKTASE